MLQYDCPCSITLVICACGCHAEDVANMLEASVSPTTRLADTAPLAWLDEAHIQTTKELSVPTPDGLVIPKVCAQQMHLRSIYQESSWSSHAWSKVACFWLLSNPCNQLQTMHC